MLLVALGLTLAIGDYCHPCRRSAQPRRPAVCAHSRSPIPFQLSGQPRYRHGDHAGLSRSPWTMPSNAACRTNLGLLLSQYPVCQARGQRLQDLQALLPSIDANLKEAYVQSDLAAQGLKIPGFPTIIGPFGYTDLRANLSWTVLSLNSLKTYMAARHYFQASQLSAQDARQMVILTVGNAYLRVLADQAQIQATQAQVDTSKVSLDQATSNHSAGTAPRLDELRAQVDHQTLEQQLIVARNTLEKDKLALARHHRHAPGTKF